MMKKLIMITHSSCDIGGSEDDFTRLIQKLNGKFRICAVFPKGARESLYSSLSYSYLIPPNRVFPISGFALKPYISFFFYSFLKILYMIPFLWKNRDADLCFLNSSVSFLEALLVKAFGIPYIVSIKEKINPPFVGKLIYKLLDKTSEKVIVISKYLKEEFFKITGSNKAVIIYSSIESNFYLKISTEAKEKNRKDKNSFVVLNIGSIYKIKGTDVLLKAASLLKKTDNIKIKIIGNSVDSKYNEKLMSLYKTLKLDDVVEFTGGMNKTDLIEEITNADCVIITSKTEGQSLVLLESLLLNKPVITTPVGVIPEVIENGINGLIYDFGDYNKIYDLMKNLQSDKLQYEKIVTNSRATFYKYFDLDSSLQKYENNILEVIHEK